MITALGVVVPARDEADHIGRALESIAASLATLPRSLETALWVVVDRSTDATGRIVEEALAGCSGRGWEHSRDAKPVGSLRHQGSRAVLSLLRHHQPASIWLLHTDADSEVPAEWAEGHLRHASEGAHCVAGLAHLGDTTHLHSEAVVRYKALLAAQRQVCSHRHVYGANLGVRADAYSAASVGGFAALATAKMPTWWSGSGVPGSGWPSRWTFGSRRLPDYRAERPAAWPPF